MKKEKEKIKTQMLRTLKSYEGKSGFDFFDSSTSKVRDGLFVLDKNELKVLLMKLNRSSKILITTKCLYLIGKSVCVKIEGRDIETMDSMSLINCEPKDSDSRLTLLLKKRQLRRVVGDFRIIKKDGTFEDLKLRKRDIVYCLSEAIKKLQFVTKKYEAI